MALRAQQPRPSKRRFVLGKAKGNGTVNTERAVPALDLLLTLANYITSQHVSPPKSSFEHVEPGQSWQETKPGTLSHGLSFHVPEEFSPSGFPYHCACQVVVFSHPGCERYSVNTFLQRKFWGTSKPKVILHGYSEAQHLWTSYARPHREYVARRRWGPVPAKPWFCSDQPNYCPTGWLSANRYNCCKF